MVRGLRAGKAAAEVAVQAGKATAKGSAAALAKSAAINLGIGGVQALVENPDATFADLAQAGKENIATALGMHAVGHVAGKALGVLTHGGNANAGSPSPATANSGQATAATPTHPSGGTQAAADHTPPQQQPATPSTSGYVDPAQQRNGQQTFKVTDAEGLEVDPPPPGSPPQPPAPSVPITPIEIEGGAGTSAPSSQQTIPENTTADASGSGKPAQPAAADGKPAQPAAGSPDSQQQIPQNTTKGTADTPPGMEPSKEAAAGGKVMTLENAPQVLSDIERLKAKEKDGGLSKDEQINLHHAENLLARAQVTNLEAEQKVRQLDPNKAKALADAKAKLERPWPGTAPKPQTQEPATTSGTTSDQTTAATSTHSSGGSLPPGNSATTNGDAPPAGTHTGEPPAGSSSSGEPSSITATWSTNSKDATTSSSSTTHSPAPPDLATRGKAMDAAKTLREKGGSITLDEAHELDQAEKAVASTIKTNLEKKKGVTGALNEHETGALDQANATLSRHAPRDRGPLPAIPDARRDIQDLSAKAAAGGTLNADEAHQLAHAQRAIAQQRVNDLTALGTSLTPQQRGQLTQFQKILDTSPYGTELPKGPPPGYDPHATNPAHREWHPPHGDKPVHPTNAEFTPDALAHSSQDIKTTIEEMNREGHAVSRHGPEVTEGQLQDRATHSIDPITETRQDGVHGRDHSGTATATQFTSERSLVHAYKTVTNNPDFKEKIKTAKEHNRTNPGDPQDYVVFDDLSLESVFGPSYEKHVRGQTRLGSKNNPTGHFKTPMAGYKIKAVYKLDPATGEYHLHTMYPNKP